VEVLTGYPTEKFMADWHFWPSVVIHPDDRAAAAVQAAQLVKGQNSTVEYRLVRADGKVIWVKDSARVEIEAGRKVVYGLVSDITERKRAEQEIQTLNETLELRVADRTRELLALYEVTAVASEALDVDTTLQQTLERVLVAMRAKEGTIHLLDEAGQALYLASPQGATSGAVSLLVPESQGQSLASRIMEHGEALLVPNLTVDPHLSEEVRPEGCYTYLGTPMRARGRTVGVLSVVGEAGQQFNVEEVALLTSIADQVGIAVENARLRQQAGEAAVMKERARLARELHDSVTQSLYSLTLLAGGGQRLARAGQLTDAGDYLADLGNIAQQALKEMRLLVYELRPSALEREGLVGALRQRLEAVEERAGVATQLLVDIATTLPALLESDLYQIAREALNNVLKHADATRVTVKISSDTELVSLEIVDNGRGFDPETVPDNGGLGLLGIRERAEKLGGLMTIFPAPGGGTSLKVCLHLQHLDNRLERC
jgi:PAS domain S-box-containing protein